MKNAPNFMKVGAFCSAQRFREAVQQIEGFVLRAPKREKLLKTDFEVLINQLAHSLRDKAPVPYLKTLTRVEDIKAIAIPYLLKTESIVLANPFPQEKKSPSQAVGLRKPPSQPQENPGATHALQNLIEQRNALDQPRQLPLRPRSADLQIPPLGQIERALGSAAGDNSALVRKLTSDNILMAQQIQQMAGEIQQLQAELADARRPSGLPGRRAALDNAIEQIQFAAEGAAEAFEHQRDLILREIGRAQKIIGLKAEKVDALKQKLRILRRELASL